MLDTSGSSLVEECSKFAMQFLYHLSHYDMDALEGMIDEFDPPLRDYFLQFGKQVHYRSIVSIDDWFFQLFPDDDNSIFFRFELPLTDEELRPREATFRLVRTQKKYLVQLVKTGPS